MFEIIPSVDGLEIRVEARNFEACMIEAFRGALARTGGGNGLRNVVVDLSKVEMIDSSAIGALLSLQKQLADSEDRVTLRHVRPAVVSVIELLRLHRVFRVAPMVAVAD